MALVGGGQGRGAKVRRGSRDLRTGDPPRKPQQSPLGSATAQITFLAAPRCPGNPAPVGEVGSPWSAPPGAALIPPNPALSSSRQPPVGAREHRRHLGPSTHSPMGSHFPPGQRPHSSPPPTAPEAPSKLHLPAAHVPKTPFCLGSLVPLPAPHRGKLLKAVFVDSCISQWKFVEALRPGRPQECPGLEWGAGPPTRRDELH